MSPPGRSAMDRLTLMQRRGWTMEAIRLAAAKPVAHPDGRHDDFFQDAYEYARPMNTAKCELNFQPEITQTPLLSMFSSMRAFSFALTPL